MSSSGRAERVRCSRISLHTQSVGDKARTRSSRTPSPCAQPRAHLQCLRRSWAAQRKRAARADAKVKPARCEAPRLCANRFRAPRPLCPITTSSAGCCASAAAMVSPTEPTSGAATRVTWTPGGGGHSSTSRRSVSLAVAAARRSDSRRDSLSDGMVQGASQLSSAMSSSSGVATQCTRHDDPGGSRGSNVCTAQRHAGALCALASTATSTFRRGAMELTKKSTSAGPWRGNAPQLDRPFSGPASSQPWPQEPLAALLEQG